MATLAEHSGVLVEGSGDDAEGRHGSSGIGGCGGRDAWWHHAHVTGSPNALVGRPHWSERWAFLAGGGLLTLVGLASVAWKQNPWGLAFLVVGAVTLLELRRSVVVRDGELRARGRLGSKVVPLSQLEQVAVSPMAEVWVRPRSGRPFYLHMVSRVASGPEPGVWTFPVRLRELATADGARLDAWEPDDTVRPPTDVHPVFSR